MSMRSRDHGRPRLRPCLRAAFNSAFGALTTRSVSPLQRRTQNAPTVHQFMLSSTGNAFARVEMKNSFSVMFHLRAKRKQVCTQHTPALRAFSQRISLRFPRQYTLTERRVTFANPQHRAAIRKDANINKPWKATANGEKAFFGEALPKHCAKPMASTTPSQSREAKGAPIQNQRRLLRFTPYASR